MQKIEFSKRPKDYQTQENALKKSISDIENDASNKSGLAKLDKAKKDKEAIQKAVTSRKNLEEAKKKEEESKKAQ